MYLVKILKQYTDGLITKEELDVQLATLTVRGTFEGMDFIGFDYDQHACVEVNLDRGEQVTRGQLGKVLTDTGLFTFAEEQKILQTCGAFTVGNAVIACEVLRITLTGNDIDILISTAKG